MEQPTRKNKTLTSFVIIFIALLIILFLSWLYIFNIYEVEIKKNKISSVEYIINVYPVNSFGTRAPFRSINFEYKVIDGESEVSEINKIGDAKITILLKGDSSKAKLQISTNKTQNISIIEIP